METLLQAEPPKTTLISIDSFKQFVTNNEKLEAKQKIRCYINLTQEVLSNLSIQNREENPPTVFFEKHFDTPNYDLLRSNFFLISRNQEWLLKQVVNQKNEEIEFFQFDNVGTIQKEISKILKTSEPFQHVCQLGFLTTMNFRYEINPSVTLEFSCWKGAGKKGCHPLLTSEISSTRNWDKREFEILFQISVEPAPSRFLALAYNTCWQRVGHLFNPQNRNFAEQFFRENPLRKTEDFPTLVHIDEESCSDSEDTE